MVIAGSNSSYPEARLERVLLSMHFQNPKITLLPELGRTPEALV
jgi:hypothetical protein